MFDSRHCDGLCQQKTEPDRGVSGDIRIHMSAAHLQGPVISTYFILRGCTCLVCEEEMINITHRRNSRDKLVEQASKQVKKKLV